MRQTNVLQFPGDSPGGNSLKAFAMVMYLFVATMLTLVIGLQEDGLVLLIVLGVIYNLFVRRKVQGSAYFKQNAILLGILFLLFLIVAPKPVVSVLMLSGLYWLLIGRTRREAPYFLRFHILTALIANFFLLMPYLILNGLVNLLEAVLRLAHLQAAAAPSLAMYAYYMPRLMIGLFFGMALWLSISALMGRTPYLPVVTENVRHWA